MNDFKGVKILNESDMKYIIGGSISIPMDGKYLSKDECKKEAKLLLNNGSVKNMSQQEIAEEIYAHAMFCVGGLTASALTDLPIIGSSAEDIADYLLSHGMTIDITDGGDTLIRRLAYAAIWLAF